MRAWVLLCAVGFCACPQPEDVFVLSGRVVDTTGEPRAGVPVQLRRARFASETRCDAFDDLSTTTTATDGTYAFELLRQEVTAGIEARRFFEIEAAGDSGRWSQRFWFPTANLALGDLGSSFASGDLTEQLIDGHVAWRGFAPTRLSRRSEVRAVRTRREWVTVPIDSLGRFDVIPVETRFTLERGRELDESLESTAAGATCDAFGISPCPLTDGRFLPFELPPDTRELVVEFQRETRVELLFHGLQLARPASGARLDFSFQSGATEFGTLGTARLRADDFREAANSCNEPGAFVTVAWTSFIRPRVLRIRFVDEADQVVPILSLQEITGR